MSVAYVYKHYTDISKAFLLMLRMCLKRKPINVKVKLNFTVKLAKKKHIQTVDLKC